MQALNCMLKFQVANESIACSLEAAAPIANTYASDHLCVRAKLK